MLTTAFTRRVRSFSVNRFLQSLVGVYAIIWIYFAVAPRWRPEWLLENYLVFAFVAILLFTYRRYPLSDLSYVCIALFLILHAYGAHHGYSNTPLGFLLQKIFHTVRPNPYDRFVHFLFGLLLVYPLHELLQRYTFVREGWCYFLSVNLILSAAALYEIFEALVAWILPPEKYDPFVGLQGDVWDGFRDMGLALSGSILATLILVSVRGAKKRAEYKVSP